MWKMYMQRKRCVYSIYMVYVYMNVGRAVMIRLGPASSSSVVVSGRWWARWAHLRRPQSAPGER